MSEPFAILRLKADANELQIKNSRLKPLPIQGKHGRRDTWIMVPKQKRKNANEADSTKDLNGFLVLGGGLGLVRVHIRGIGRAVVGRISGVFSIGLGARGGRASSLLLHHGSQARSSAFLLARDGG